MAEVRWLSEPEEHDYPAAETYLSLIAGPAVVEATVGALRAAEQRTFKAKDLLRASRLPTLPATDPHVASDLAKIQQGKALSPILVVRGDVATDRPAQIADGYHRVCAVYLTDENTPIPVRIVDLAA